jgi:hypothetical protein
LTDLLLLFDTVAGRSSWQREQPSKSPWKNTSFANLVRYEPSGTYFARVRVGGKLIRPSLKTKVLTVTKLKLADSEKKEKGRWKRQRVTGGKATFSDLTNHGVSAKTSG